MSDREKELLPWPRRKWARRARVLGWVLAVLVIASCGSIDPTREIGYSPDRTTKAILVRDSVHLGSGFVNAIVEIENLRTNTVERYSVRVIGCDAHVLVANRHTIEMKNVQTGENKSAAWSYDRRRLEDEIAYAICTSPELPK